MPQPKYRIGLLVDGLEAPKWVRDLADWARAHPGIELATLIVCAPPRSTPLDKLLQLETKFLCRGNEYRSYAALSPIWDCAVQTIDGGDVNQVARLKLDAIVRCGRAIPNSALLDAAKDGIISIVAGARGDGFAEVIGGRPETPFSIVRLRRPRERPDVLFRGSIATALLYSWNVIAIQARAFQYLRLTLERLACGNVEAVADMPATTCPSKASNMLTYAVRTAYRSACKVLRRAQRREFNWQVAFARQTWSECRFDQANIISNPPNAFLADPFSITVDGIDYLFVEEFPFDTRKGVIAAYRLERDTAERIGVVLEQPYHLSFPFLFQHKGKVYMVPEGGGGRSVKLYRSTSFPTGWSEVKTLLADVPAVDTIVFEHDSRWWMLTTIQGQGPALNNAELHAYYADDPLGDWRPHAQNPIVMDAGKGRNGGFVRDKGGRPCRVAQRPGFTFYGAGSAVYRIDELTPEAYRETLLKEVRPSFFPKLDGTHHVHCAGGLTVFDFMRVERPGGSAKSRPRSSPTNNPISQRLRQTLAIPRFSWRPFGMRY